MKRFWTLFILIVLLASGCQLLGGDGDGNNDGVITQSSTAIINWEREPTNVVFRAEVTGGELANTLPGYNEIPLCTIYGDNRVVWTVNNRSTGLSQVLFDTISDATIINFIEALTVYYRIYDYDTQAELQGDALVPSVEQITVNVNGLYHVTDAFANWDFQFFEDIVQQCHMLSTTPIEFEPTSAWVRAEAITFDSNRASVPLPESVLNFEDLANSGEPRWVEGTAVRILWAQLRATAPDIQIEQGGGVYRIALEIPGVTVNARPAPDD